MDKVIWDTVKCRDMPETSASVTIRHTSDPRFRSEKRIFKVTITAKHKQFEHSS